MDSEPATDARARGWWRPVALVVVILAIIVLANTTGLGDRFAALRGWIEELGPWGPFVFILIYIAAVLLAVPGAAITVAAGALFGSVLGVVVVSVGSTVGASLAFLIARHFARDATHRWLEKHENFRKLDRLVERHGAIIVALTRLVPIFPFNLINYGFGLTSVPFRTYVFWSWLCMLPVTVLYVVGADAVTRSITEQRVPWLPLAAALAALAVLVPLVRYARGRLAEGSASPADRAPEEPGRAGGSGR